VLGVKSATTKDISEIISKTVEIGPVGYGHWWAQSSSFDIVDWRNE
jgi:hypothetical protein